MLTYREHFKDLQPVGGPAFLGFVNWQGEVDIPGILREEQHQEDGPASEGRFSQCGLIPFFLLYLQSSSLHHLSASD